MPADFTGGLRAERDFFLAEKPENPEMRESASIWVSDDEGRFGFPRLCVEAVAHHWHEHGVEANFAYPDGRVFVGHGPGERHETHAADGAPRILGAGPLRIETIEPFKHLRVTYDGDMSETTVADQARKAPLGPKTRFRFEIDCFAAAPPIQYGQLTEEGAKRMASGVEAASMGAAGGGRFEQLFLAKGRLAIQGQPAVAFQGRGLRIRRTGVRNTAGLTGHIWMSTVFPSGKAFGVTAFAPQPDGAIGFNEGYVYENGELIPVKQIEAPWLEEFTPTGAPCDLVLEAQDGRRVRIKGVTHDAVCIPPGGCMFGAWPHYGFARNFYHQGGALYSWDGESAYGMIERSLRPEKVRLSLLPGAPRASEFAG